jgi:hypothetical protein
MSCGSSNTVDTHVTNLKMKSPPKPLDGMLAESRAGRAMLYRWSDQWPLALNKRPLV